MSTINLKKTIIRSVIGLFLFILILNSFTIVNYGHVGLRKTLGSISNNELASGIQWKIPFFQSIISTNVQVSKVEFEAEASSKDLQPIHTKISINYQVNAKSVFQLLSNVGNDYEDSIVSPAVQEILKEITAHYSAEELISKRDTVSSEVKAGLTERMARYDLQVREINIVNFKFSDAFNASIEAKQVAAQNAMKAENDLKRIQVEAQQSIEQAKAEAESLRLKKQEVTPDLIALKQIEVQQKAIEKWDGKLPQVTGGATPFINLSDVGSSAPTSNSIKNANAAKAANDAAVAAAYAALKK